MGKNGKLQEVTQQEVYTSQPAELSEENPPVMLNVLSVEFNGNYIILNLGTLSRISNRQANITLLPDGVLIKSRDDRLNRECFVPITACGPIHFSTTDTPSDLQ